MPKFNVLLRTCDVVHSLHNAPRPYGLDKRGVIKVCFASLVESLREVDHEIHIIGDRLSDEILEFFNRYSVKITNKELGNDESLRESIRQGLAFPDDEWIYFCEDDYLHTPNAFALMNEFIEHREEIITYRPRLRVTLGTKLKDRPLVIHPPDYPDRYRPKSRKPSFLFVSKHHHWRQVDMTTFTIMLERKTLLQFEPIFTRSTNGADDGYLSHHLYWGGESSGKCLCVSPVPGVATHMHEEVMSPVVDWSVVFDRYGHVLNAPAESRI